MSWKGFDSPSIRRYRLYNDIGNLYEGDIMCMFGTFDDNGSYNFRNIDTIKNCAPYRTPKNYFFGGSRKRTLDKYNIIDG